MKTTFNLALASALMLAVTVPTLSHAAYFVDQTKTWAIDTNEQDPMAKRPAIHAARRKGTLAYAMVPSSGAASGAGEVSATGGGSLGYNELLSHSNNY
jgi:hypothetical protein